MVLSLTFKSLIHFEFILVCGVKTWSSFIFLHIYVQLLGMQICAATVESSMEIPQTIKKGMALWTSDSTCGNLSEETQNTNLKGHKHHYIHCSIIYSW